MFQVAWLSQPTPEYPKGKFTRANSGFVEGKRFNDTVQHRMALGDAVYRSVYKFAEWKDGRPIKESAIIDRIYFDFDDAEDPQRAIDDAAKLASPSTTQYFSGKKGIGVLLHFKPVDIHPSMKADVLKQTCNAMIENFDLQTADHAVIGDLNRVHRIINTRHQDTGLYAIPITSIELKYMTIVGLKEMAKNRRNVVRDTKPSMFHTDHLLLVERMIIKGRMEELLKNHLLSRRFYEGNQIIRSMKHKYELVATIEKLEAELAKIRAKHREKTDGATPEEQWLIKAVREFKATGRAASGSRQSEHKSRVHLAKLAHECGWSFDEICDIYTGADDYDRKITEQHVRSCMK